MSLEVKDHFCWDEVSAEDGFLTERTIIYFSGQVDANHFVSKLIEVNEFTCKSLFFFFYCFEKHMSHKRAAQTAAMADCFCTLTLAQLASHSTIKTSVYNLYLYL